MEWPQGLCMEPLGPPSCVHGMATRLMHGATRTPLLYSWNGHKAYVWSHWDPPYVFMEWPQGLCMEPLGPPSCIHGMATRLMYGARTATRLMYGATRTPSCIHGRATRLMYGATRTPSCFHEMATKLTYGATRTPPHVFMEWPQGLCI